MFKKFFVFTWELIKIICVSLAIILPVRYYLIQPFYVKGASMEPNFHDHEYLIIDELSYRFKTPVRGEVIVFRYPQNPQEYFIKRVIGLPGEDVQIKDGRITVYNDFNPEGLLLEEDYLPLDLMTASYNHEKTSLGENEYFVLGDNRNASKDSRIFGAVNKSFITGRVMFRGWPLNEITIFNASKLPKY